MNLFIGCLKCEDSLDHADGCYEFGMADLVIDLVDAKMDKKEDPFLVHFENLRYNSVIPGRSLLQVYHPSNFKYAWQNKSSNGSKSLCFLSHGSSTVFTGCLMFPRILGF